jgi:uncharacterized membrane protein YbaN (DUF454 family)
MGKTKKIVLISLGIFFIALGIVGIFIPVLPTTPFLIVAAALFANTSKRFYDWLLSNRLFGKILQDYRKGKGIPLKVKVYLITLLWITLAISAYFTWKIFYVPIILLLVGIGVTIHILLIKTYRQTGPGE